MKIYRTDVTLTPTFSAFPSHHSPTLCAPSLSPPECTYRKDDCNICKKLVKNTDKGIQCDNCDEWIHTKCEKISENQYEIYNIDPEKVFICKKCRKCNVCERTIATNHKRLKCNTCLKFIHPKCNKMNEKEYKIAKDNESNFECIFCFAIKFPFASLTSNNFEVTVNNGALNPDNVELNFSPTEYQKHVFNEISHLTFNNNEEIETDEDEEIIPSVNCEYYTCDDFLKKEFNSETNFSILHLNIHSVRMHIGQLQLYLELLNFNFDAICLSESKIEKGKENLTTDISLPGYQTPVGTPTESTKGGVLIYIKNGLNFKPRPDLNIYESKYLESFFIEIINEKAANDILGVIYRHPSQNEVTFNEDHLPKILEKTSKNSHKNIYICGDINFNLLNIEKHSETANFFELMMSNFLLPTITKPTKINPGKSTLIDNIFTNNISPNTVSGNLVLNLSDGHLPSFLLVPKLNQTEDIKNHNLKRRNIKNINFEQFDTEYDSIRWGDIIRVRNNDPNKSMESFLFNFNILLDKHAPLEKISNKEIKQSFKPWINTEIKTKIKKKDKVYLKYIKCKDKERKKILETSYKNKKIIFQH